MTAAGTVMIAARRPAPAGETRPAAPPAGCRSGSFEFGACLDAVPLARRHARVVLREWGLAELLDSAGSVVTELVQNSVQATIRAGLCAPVRLTLLAGLRTVLVIVRDAVPDPPAPRQPAAGPDDLEDPDDPGPDDPGPDGLGPWDGDDDADPDQHGRGLLMVATLSACWNWKLTPDGGKVVRALIRATIMETEQ